LSNNAKRGRRGCSNHITEEGGVIKQIVKKGRDLLMADGQSIGLLPRGRRLVHVGEGKSDLKRNLKISFLPQKKKHICVGRDGFV